MLDEVLVGERFCRLVVIEQVDSQRYLCDCDCGNETVVYAHNLKAETTRSCGCLRREYWKTGKWPPESAGRHKR